MFVHFKSIKKPVFTDLIPFTFLGVTLEEHPDADVSIELTPEEYGRWVIDPSLQYKYSIEKDDAGKWHLALVSQRLTLPDMELLPIREDDEKQYDVLLVLQNGNEALVHIYNNKMSQDPKLQVTFFATEAEDSMSAVFEMKATGPDTFQAVNYDPDNVTVWVREPIQDVTYAVRIVK